MGQPRRRTDQWKAFEARWLLAAPLQMQQAYLREQPRLMAETGKSKATGGGVMRHIITSLCDTLAALNNAFVEFAEMWEAGQICHTRADIDRRGASVARVVGGEKIKEKFQFKVIRHAFANLPFADQLELIIEVINGARSWDSAKQVCAVCCVVDVHQAVCFPFFLEQCVCVC